MCQDRKAIRFSGNPRSQLGSRLPGLDQAPPEELMKNTLEMINQMQRDGVIGRYAIGGAVGATFYLEPSATLDVHVFVALPTALGSSLLSLAPVYEYLTKRGCEAKGEYIVIGDWPVQFLPSSDTLEREALAEAVKVDVEGVATWVMTAEHLVAMALRTGRAKDGGRIVRFFEQDAVDAGKLKRILSRHGLLPKWQRFERRYLGDE